MIGGEKELGSKRRERIASRMMVLRSFARRGGYSFWWKEREREEMKNPSVLGFREKRNEVGGNIL